MHGVKGSFHLFWFSNSTLMHVECVEMMVCDGVWALVQRRQTVTLL